MRSTILFYDFRLSRFLFALEDGAILVVGHASSLDTCSRQLRGLEPLSVDAMDRIMSNVPYCSLVQLRRLNSQWKLIEPPVPGCSLIPRADRDAHPGPQNQSGGSFPAVSDRPEGHYRHHWHYRSSLRDSRSGPDSSIAHPQESS